MRKPRDPNWLLLGIICISALGWLINIYPPNSQSLITLFFVLIFFSALSLLLYALKNVRRAILYSIFITGFLVLRYLQLREFYYPLLLAAILLSVEFTLSGSSNIHENSV